MEATAAAIAGLIVGCMLGVIVTFIVRGAIRRHMARMDAESVQRVARHRLSELERRRQLKRYLAFEAKRDEMRSRTSGDAA